MNDIKQKYARGEGGNDASENGPTGDAYMKHQMAMNKKARDAKNARDRARQEEVAMIKAQKENLRENNEDDDDSSSDEYDDLLDDLDKDPEMEALRSARMNAMRAQQTARAENLAKGHGQYRYISQDEFLTEVTGSEWVALHFFHKEFERCKIMHHHLELIAPLHIECKFLNIDAEKTPFFVQKLQVQTLPTLVIFKDGVVQSRLTGFQELSIDPSEPDKWHTSKLQAWIASTGAIKFKMPTEEMRKEMAKMGIVQRGSIWGENRAHHDESDSD